MMSITVNPETEDPETSSLAVNRVAVDGRGTEEPTEHKMTLRRTRICSALAMTLTGLLTLGNSASAEQAIVTFGIVPQQSASKLAATWGPILGEISRRAGVRVEFRTAPDIPTFERRLADGEYDVAYMNPYHYTVFHARSGYLAVAKEKARKIQGIIVVRQDSPITSIQQLEGQTLAFPSPAAFAASVLPRAELRRNGISFTTKYVASHDSVYFAVADGLFAGGGGITRTFETVSPDTKAALRVLWKTDSFAPHAIAIHPRLPADVMDSILKAMISLDAGTDGKALLAAIGFSGIEAASDGDWDDIRRLDISPSEASGM